LTGETAGTYHGPPSGCERGRRSPTSFATSIQGWAEAIIVLHGGRPVLSRKELVTILGCVLVLGVAHLLLMRQWNLFFSDTRYHYLPTLEVLNQEDPGFVSLFVAPFFRPNKDLLPLAQDAKPVFIVSLRAWHLVYCRLAHCPPGFESPHAYLDFVTFWCLCAFGLLCLLARKLGSLPIGIVAGFLTFLSPWGLQSCYFATYTAMSLSMIFLMIYLSLCQAHACSYVSGLLLALCAMTNQSLLGCLIAQPLILAITHWRSGGYRMIVRMGVFSVGIATPFLATEYLATTRLVLDHFGAPHVQSPLTILPLYAIRNTTDARMFLETDEYLDVWDYSRFIKLLNFNSTVSVVFLTLVALVLLGIVLLADGDRLRRFWRWFRSETTFPVHVAGLFAGVTLMLIDLRNGPRMSRCYFVAVPFVFLTALFLVRYWTTLFPRRLCTAVLAFFALAWGIENAVKVAELYQLYHAARLTLREFQQRGERVVCLRSDRYNIFLRNLADLDVVDDENEVIPSDVRYIVTGPSVPSAMEGTQPQGDHYVALRKKSINLVPKKAIPFYALYPFLTYEDPFATHQLLVKHRIRANSYKCFTGSVRIWEVGEATDLPSLAELIRFPARPVAHTQLGALYRARFELQNQPPSRHRTEMLNANAQQITTWVLLLEARGGFTVEEGLANPEVQCRQAFDQLRIILGEKDWRDGRMPRYIRS
jgi:hypothetical protein